MSLRLPVDHVGILGASASRMAECWRRLGFHVVGPADLKSGARGDEQELGQRSAHIMFPGDYIELTSVNPPRPDHHLARFFDRPLGIRLMILASRDIGSDHHRCQQAGLEPGDVRTPPGRCRSPRPPGRRPARRHSVRSRRRPRRC